MGPPGAVEGPPPGPVLAPPPPPPPPPEVPPDLSLEPLIRLLTAEVNESTIPPRPSTNPPRNPGCC